MSKVTIVSNLGAGRYRVLIQRETAKIEERLTQESEALLSLSAQSDEYQLKIDGKMETMNNLSSYMTIIIDAMKRGGEFYAMV